MAYIRSIKSTFFTSDDIVTLSPLARLLYIALWTEADREGRMTWRPGSRWRHDNRARCRLRFPLYFVCQGVDFMLPVFPAVAH